MPAAPDRQGRISSPEPYITGPIATTLHYQVATNGTGEVVGRFDLKGATAAVAPLDWSKEPGTDGQRAAGAEARGRRQAHDGRFRESRQRPLRQGPGALRRRQRPAADYAAASSRSAATDALAIDWKRAPDGVELSLRGPSLELPRVRNALKVRDEYAAKDPAGRRRDGASKHQDHPAAQAGPDPARNAGLRQRRASKWRASASPRPIVTIGGGKGSTFRVTPAGTGRTLFLYVADFGDDAEGCGLARRPGRTAICTSKAVSDDASPARRSTGTLKMGPYPPAEGDAARRRSAR